MSEIRKTAPQEQKVDLSDIARGRRITAVVASEMDLTPRKTIRPPKPTIVTKLTRKVARFLGTSAY